MSRLKSALPLRRLAYLASFSLAKAVAYSSPLILAIFLSPADYVAAEQALAVGAAVCAVAVLGLPFAIPQFQLLRQPPSRIDDLANVGAAVVGGVAIVIAAITGLFGNWIVGLCALTVAIYATQNTAYAQDQAAGRATRAVWVQNFALLAFVTLTLVIESVGTVTMAGLTVGLGVLVAVLTVQTARRGFYSLAPEPRRRLVAAVRFGLPVAFSSAASLWLIGGLRSGASQFMSTRDAASFLVDFRLASALLIVHQAVSVGLYARLYVMESCRYDRYLSIYAAGLAGLAALAAAVFSLLANNGLLPGRVQGEIGFAPTTMFLVFFWSMTSSFELLVVRSGRAFASTLGLGALSLLPLVLLPRLISSPLTASQFALVGCILLFSALCVQTLCLRSVDRPVRSMFVSSIVLIVVAIFTFVIP